MNLLNEKQFLFIIGAPRSGTTWLQIMLGAHPRVATTVELNLFRNYTAPWMNSWEATVRRLTTTGMHQGLSCLWSEDEFRGFLQEFLVKTYCKVIANNPDASHILDKSCGYSYHTEHILSLIPKGRFIHIIRDGRDVAASMIAAKQTIGGWGGTVERAATLWKEHVTAALEAKTNSDRYLELRYEDLLNNGIPTLRRVFEFCDLPVTDEEAADIYKAHEFKAMKEKRQEADGRFKRPDDHYRKGVAGTWKSDLNVKQRETFNEIAGDLLQQLGYTENSKWTVNGCPTLPTAIYKISRRMTQAVSLLSNRR